MANPLLNERTFTRARTDDDAGWAAPGTTWHAPVSDGPVSPYRTEVMTVNGAVSATAVLFVLLLATGVVGWYQVHPSSDGTVAFPGWVLAPMLVGLGLVLASVFRPKIARVTAPLYAICEGLVVGAIAHAYDTQWHGIAAEAALGTAGVFATMLFLYSTKLVKVTDKMRRVVIAATVGVLAVYAVGFLVRLVTGSASFLDGSSGLSIVLSLVIVGVAAFNLMLDFDMIERSARAGAPRYMEWFAALGLMVTVVWLYLELLRLLAKLRQR
jgi:uncharacterized YccA/Bax inhibitor family protein